VAGWGWIMRLDQGRRPGRPAASFLMLVTMGQPHRVAFLNCEDAAKWDDHLEVWRRALGGAIEWVPYRCWLGELPTPEQLRGMSGIVVPGSHHTAVVAEGESPPLSWLGPVMALLRAVAERQAPRLLCVCFGHQLLAAATGGAVGRNEDGRFVFGAEDVVLRPSWESWVRGLPSMLPLQSAEPQRAVSKGTGEGGGGGGGSLRLIEAHGDCVTTLPPGATLMASSATCGVEIYSIGSGVLSMQGHPEFVSTACGAASSCPARLHSNRQRARVLISCAFFCLPLG
jgi:GMP synthase-like glutamine amidotransferase